MMKARSRLGLIGLFCIVIGPLLAEGAGLKQQDTNIGRFAREYREARTELQRRAVCLEAIDAGQIARGNSVAIVDAVFGTTCAKKLPTGREPEWGVVEFHPLPLLPGDAMSAAHAGWYLAVEFDSSGAVQNYYLSNVHR
jgi:hypothetical protein